MLTHQSENRHYMIILKVGESRAYLSGKPKELSTDLQKVSDEIKILRNAPILQA